jgi:GT2 family glycosyltransferase
MSDPLASTSGSPIPDPIPDPKPGRVGFVAIGRNEGDRLRACLRSLAASGGPIVYVDSGSTDGSVEFARSIGAEVVELDRAVAFSAARARNAGFERLRALRPDLGLVHFVDGDCTLEEGWVGHAVEVLDREPAVVAVCGRRRERNREASVYNRICDVEWRSPPAGEARAFGGEVLIRVEALARVGGYDPSVIAAEDDELAIRLRAGGGRIWRLERTSSHHDAAIERMAQWWQRAIRCGHGYAQVGSLHPEPPEYYFRRERRRAWIWGGLLPAVALLLAWPTRGLSLALLFVYPIQIARIAAGTARDGFEVDAWPWAISCTASHPANLYGMLKFYTRRFRGQGTRIIEYKGTPEPGR